MTSYGQDFRNAITVYKNEVRASERRSLRLARVAPQAKEGDGWVRKAAAWLGRQRVSLGQALPPAHGERAAG
jgi:hypothetical protein